MPELYHGYSLNEVREDVNWSTREVTFHKDILDKLPNKGSAHTPVSRHGHSQLITESGEDALVTLQNDGKLRVNAALGINIDPIHELDVQSQSGNASIRVKANNAATDDAYLSVVGGTAGDAKIAFGYTGAETYAEIDFDCGSDELVFKNNSLTAFKINSGGNILMASDLTIQAQLRFGDRTDVGAGGTSGSPTTQSVAESSYYTVQVSGAGDEYYRFINPTDGQVILVDPKDAGDGPPGSAYFDRDPTGGSPDYVLLDYGPYLIVYTASDSRWTIL